MQELVFLDTTDQIAMNNYKNAQRNELIKLYLENADLLTADDYAVRIGIKVERVKKFLVQLRNGESIFPKNHYRRKSRVTPFQTLVMAVLQKDPSTPLKDIKKTIAQAEKLRNAGNVTIDMQDIEAIQRMEITNDEIKQLAPSSSSLSRFFTGKTKDGEDRTMPVLSFKRETTRGIDGNTDENKTLRIQRVQRVMNLVGAGALLVCVDETS